MNEKDKQAFEKWYQEELEREKAKTYKESKYNKLLAEKGFAQYVFQATLLMERSHSQRLVEALEDLEDEDDLRTYPIIRKALKDYEGGV